MNNIYSSFKTTEKPKDVTDEASSVDEEALSPDKQIDTFASYSKLTKFRRSPKRKAESSKHCTKLTKIAELIKPQPMEEVSSYIGGEDSS